MSDNNGKSRKKMSVWKKIWYLTALLVSITTLVDKLADVGIIDFVVKFVSKEVPPPAKDVPPPVIETRSPEVLPLSLNNMMGSQSFLYWFWVKIDNKSSGNLNIVVSFTVLRGSARAGLPTDFTIPPGTLWEKVIEPNLTPLRHDNEPDTLVINWKIQDDRGHQLGADTVEVQLLGANIFKWDLTYPGKPGLPDKTPVPKDFLLASLTAWTLTSSPEIEERRKQCRSQTNTDEPSARQWLAGCYGVFRDPFNLVVRSKTILFPPGDEEKIRTPSQVLQEHEADPLEAALLLGALSREDFKKLGVRLVLLAVPEPGSDPNNKTILFAWSASPGGWHALDTARVDQTFEDNEQEATARLTKLLEEEPGILEAIDKPEGVLFTDEQSTIALDFTRAEKHFRIRGLPPTASH